MAHRFSRSLLLGSLAGIAVAGVMPLRLTRRANVEGLEDPAMARAYDRMSRSPQFALLRRLVVREVRRYGPKGTLVDVGCGPGYLLAKLATTFALQARLMGVDVSQSMLDRGARNLAAVGLSERVGFRLGDAARLPLEDASRLHREHAVAAPLVRPASSPGGDVPCLAAGRSVPALRPQARCLAQLLLAAHLRAE